MFCNQTNKRHNKWLNRNELNENQSFNERIKQIDFFFFLSYAFFSSCYFFHFPIWFPWCFHVALIIVVAVNVFLLILSAIDVLVVKTAIMIIVPAVICCLDVYFLNTLIKSISYWFNWILCDFGSTVMI